MKSDAWPFVAPSHRHKFGESPFRIRGTVYAGIIERTKRRLPGGLSSLSAHINHPEVDAFLRDTIFLATSLYDIEPLMHMLRATSLVAQIPLERLVRQGAHVAAEQDVTGKYRAQLRSTSPEEMAQRLPRIFDRYFDPCHVDATRIDSTGCEMKFSRLPASALGLYIWQNEGFIAGALEAVGAKDVRFFWTNALPDGDVDGVPTQSITNRITWTNPVNDTSK